LSCFTHVETIIAAGDEESEKKIEDVENLEELIDMMFNEDHTKELSKKEFFCVIFSCSSDLILCLFYINNILGGRGNAK